VKVVEVRTMTRKGKPRRSRHKMTKTSDWKRAVVVLEENSRIELF
jgi:large subunit ribosomal protein L23